MKILITIYSAPRYGLTRKWLFLSVFISFMLINNKDETKQKKLSQRENKRNTNEP